MQFNFRQGISNARTSPPFLIFNGANINLYANSTPIILNFAHGNSNYIFYEYSDIQNAWTNLPTSGVYYIYWDIDTVSAQRSFGFTQYNPFIFTRPSNPSIGQMYFDQGYTKWFEWSGVTWVEKIRVFAGMIYNGRLFPQNLLSQVNIFQLCEAGAIIFDNNGNPIVVQTDDGFEFLTSITVSNNTYSGVNNYKFSKVTQISGILAQNTYKYQCLGLSDSGLVLVSANSNVPVYALCGRDGNSGELVKIITNGFIEDYSFFKFTDPPGSPLYVDENSQLTTYNQNNNSVYQELGYIVSPFKIYFKPSVQIIPFIQPTVSISITPSITLSTSITPSISPTISITPSITPTFTPTITATQTVTPSITPTQTITQTINLSASITPTVTPTNSVSISLSPTITPTNTITPSITPTNTITPSVTSTSTVTPTVTVTPTLTSSITFTPSSTITPTVSVTLSSTATVTPSTTVTITPSNSVTPTISISPSATLTPTPTLSASPTAITPSPTPSVALSNFVTPSNTLTITSTITPTVLTTLSNTATPTPSITSSNTVTPTNSTTPTTTPTLTSTISVTPTNTVTNSVTPSNTSSISVTPTNTPTVTPTSSLTITPTITPSVTPSAGSGYVQSVMADSPIAFWQLNDGTGTTAVDSSGNGYNGTYTNTYTLDQPSIMPHGSGTSLELNGNGYVALPAVSALNTLNLPLTLELWIKTPTPMSGMALLDLGNNESASIALSTVASQMLTFGYVNLINNANSTTALAANTTYHCVVTVDSSGNIIFYTNGVATGTGTTNGAIGSGAGTIGTYANNISLYKYTGYVQNVAVYNYALTAAQVASHYNAG